MKLYAARITLLNLREDLHLEANILADRIAESPDAEVKQVGRQDLADLVRQATAIDTVLAALGETRKATR